MTYELYILVPACNEAPRIGTVLDVLCSYTTNIRAKVGVDNFTLFK